MSQAWQDIAAKCLETFGHRNWIVIADAAYPDQAQPGITTVATGQGLFETVYWVLQQLYSASHVRPIVTLDQELRYIAQGLHPGASKIKAKLDVLVTGLPVREVPHDQIIDELDEAGKQFRVLVLKTTCTVPYTTIFLNLQCGYWSADQEAQLRQAMAETQ